MLQLIKQIVKENFILITAAILHSSFSGFLWVKVCTNIENMGIYALALTIQELTFGTIQNLFLSPTYSKVIAKLKKRAIKQVQTKEELGQINTKFLKINGIRNFIEQLLIVYKTLLSTLAILYSIYKSSTNLIILANILFLISFSFYFYYTQSYVIKQREAAWASTENNLFLLQEEVLHHENMRQKLRTSEKIESSLQEEAKSWNRFYVISNIALICNAILLIMSYLINYSNIFICYAYVKTINETFKSIKILSQYSQDFKFITQQTLEKNNNKYRNTATKNLIAKNIKVYNIGPFSLIMKTKIIQIKGKNGVGKTLFAKALANLVPFSGEIEAPKCVYIGLESQSLYNKKSKGERIFEQIEIALDKNYDLFIFDEALDVLSKENFERVEQLLKDKKMIIITHKPMSFMENSSTLSLTSNGFIEEESPKFISKHNNA